MSNKNENLYVKRKFLRNMCQFIRKKIYLNRKPIIPA